jgi:sporulation protein YlmC with PRC-barrel domain
MASNQSYKGSSKLGSLTEVRPGTPVFASDHKHVGKVHDIVVDANNDELTRIVVNAGPHFPAPGFGAPKLVSVSPEEVEELHQDKMIVRCNGAVFEHLPIYADWGFEGASGRRGIGLPWKLPHREKSEREIERGAGVWRVDPFVHIGDVERVLVDEDLGHVRAIVIRRGHIFGHNVVLPIEYVVEFSDAFLHVRMTDAEIEALEPFHSAPEP